MKKRIFSISVFVILFAAFLSLCVYADNDVTEIRYVSISDTLGSIEIGCSISSEDVSLYDSIYLFEVLPGTGCDVTRSAPLSRTASAQNIVFSLPFDKNDLYSLQTGYVIAVKTSDGFLPVSEISYTENPELIAGNSIEYPVFKTKKGLSVQYIADAQILGAGHTVVNAEINRMFSLSENDAHVDFVYGDEIYSLNKESLSSLDNRIKTLTEAGIHIYLDLLLRADAGAPEFLYYEGCNTGNSFCMPNVRDENCTKAISAITYFLADRYSSDSGEYGFCGSFIIGYEVNSQTENNNAGITLIGDYAEDYSELLRICSISSRTAYSGSRVFVSVSNQFGAPDAPEGGNTVFGAADFLREISARAYDIPFNVAVNPYTVNLSYVEYWNELSPKNDMNTEFVTMKNIDVLTDFLKTEELLYKRNTRTVLISGFGTSGRIGDKSEKKQAASFLYAYYTVLNNDMIEAFIWHRHVDHNGENGLTFGLYSSTDVMLDADERKLIYDVFAYADVKGDQAYGIVSEVSEYLPSAVRSNVRDYFLDEANKTRSIDVVSSVSQSSVFTNREKLLSLDFGSSVYGFYPSDNAEYLENLTENSTGFMRISLDKLSYFEYMGAGYSFSDFSSIRGCDTFHIRVRSVSDARTSDIRIAFSGDADGLNNVLYCDAAFASGEWTDLYFPIGDFTGLDYENCRIKLWMRTDSHTVSGIYLDVQCIDFIRSSLVRVPRLVYVLLPAAAVVTVMTAVFCVIRKKSK